MQAVDFPDNVKEAFATAMLRLGDAFKAACAVFPNDTPRAVTYALPLSRDQTVLRHMEDMRREAGDEDFLPTRADVARELYNLGVDAGNDARDRIQAFKSYAELMGYAPKNGAETTNNITQNNVMIVREIPADQWEKRAVEQQARLINAATEHS